MDDLSAGLAYERALSFAGLQSKWTRHCELERTRLAL
jgi:hypothetical protein